MKDYASMSDVDVARMVSAYLWGSVYSLDGVVLHSETSDPFDPCNNPADAWPIMLESKISIMWQTAEESWCAWANGDLEEGCWDWKYCPDDYHVHSSALRAAMIVFLMMKENEND